MMTRAAAVVVIALAAAPSSAFAQTPELEAAADREIVHVAGDLYRFRDGKRHSVFLATRDGIVVVDPQNLYAASWLQSQLQKRFPNTRVSHVVLTHHHAHSAGGTGIFKSVAIAGHENFRGDLAYTSSISSGDYRYVVPPNLTVADRRTIELGGSEVDLVHTGPFHSSDMIAVGFRKERFAYVADSPPINAVPFRFGSMAAKHVVRWLQAVATIECDTMLFSDGTTMPCRAVAELSQYLGAMRAGLLGGFDRGYSQAKAIERLPLAAYRASPHYAGRAQQIAEMYRQIAFRRGDITVAGIANYLPEREPAFCTGFERCEAGGAVPAGSIAATITLGRRFGGQVEFSLSEQFWTTRTRPRYQEETVLRPVVTSGLLRFNLTRSRKLSLLAGVTSVTGYVQGLDRVEGTFIPTGGRHAIRVQDRRTGITAGLELSQPIGPLRVVVPLRFTQINGKRPTFWPSRLNGSAGLGVSFPLFRVLE